MDIRNGKELKGLQLNHRKLCIIASKYIRSQKGLIQPYSVCELERVGESPDAFGWGRGSTILIEAKYSRADFLSDKKKHFRIYREQGVGDFRYYICPTGLIKEHELPVFWGLLYVDEKGKITPIKNAKKQESSKAEELKIICSIITREGIKPQLFSYKNYKSEQKEIESVEKVIESYEQV